MLVIRAKGRAHWNTSERDALRNIAGRHQNPEHQHFARLRGALSCGRGVGFSIDTRRYIVAAMLVAVRGDQVYVDVRTVRTKSHQHTTNVRYIAVCMCALSTRAEFHDDCHRAI